MRKLAFIVLAMFVTSVAMAQVTTSSMSGKITDAGGQPLIGAAVVAVHTPSGTQYGAAVDLNGNYRILNMRPGGPYTISVQMLGYNTTEYQGIELALGDNYVLDADLAEAAWGMDEIVVRGVGRDNMNTDRAGAVTTVNASSIAAQPTISRSISDMMKLSPYASSTSNGVALGGGNYRSSYVTVDGAAFNNSFGIGQNMPSGGSPISLDALEQITVSTTPYDVRQSGFTGGAINAVTRSGDNDFSGSAYVYFNNDDLKGTKTKIGNVSRDEQTYKLYGFRFGGPIIKNKLFFFVNAEFENETRPGPSGRARTNDQAGWGTNYPNVNRPTVNQMETMRDYLINKYDYDPGQYQEYSYDTPGHKILARLDWNINEDHKVNVRYSTTKTKYQSSPSTSTSPMTSSPFSGSRTGNSALYYNNTRYWQQQNFHSVAGELNSRFGKISNTLRVTYSYQDEPRSYDGKTFPMVDILELDQTSNSYTPLATFGTELFTEGNLREVKTFTVTDDVQWTMGKHNLIGGVQYEFNKARNGYMQAGAGWYVYSSWDDFVNDATPRAFAITHSNKADGSQAIAEFNSHQISLYAQDKIDISDNFKLTAGLRLEMPVYPSLDNNYNPAFASMEFHGKKYSTDDLPKARLQVSPRVGFNWDISGDRVHILRGGTGIFTGRLPYVWLVSAVGNSNVQQTTYFYSDASKATLIPSRFNTTVDEIVKDLYGGSYTHDPNNLVAPQSPTILSKKLRMPSTWKTSLAYDVRLPGNVLGTLEGTYSRNLTQVIVTNIGLEEPTKDGLRLSANDYRDAYKGYINQNSNNRDVVPYLMENGGPKGWHTSFTARLEKNFHFGLSAMAAYTYSAARTISDGIGDQVSSAWSTNSYSINGINDHNLGYASYVSPHRLIASLSYRQKNSTISIFYEGSNLGYYESSNYTYTRYSYTYTSNVVGDSRVANLIYVPKTKDELTFADITDKAGNVTYSKEDQANDFWNFVNQDSYLKTRKGKYAERNGAVMPFRSRFDIKFLQDLTFDTRGGRTNTLQFGMDITNVGNLLNKKWGNVKTVTNAQILKVNAQNDGTYTYNFVGDGSDRVTKTFNPVAKYASTFSIQFSVRYIFN